MKPYYYVFKSNGQPPNKRHEIIAFALIEAERLASQHPGQHFEILKCVGITSTPSPAPSTFWMDDEEP
jgi:hypothetical protein